MCKQGVGSELAVPYTREDRITGPQSGSVWNESAGSHLGTSLRFIRHSLRRGKRITGFGFESECTSRVCFGRIFLTWDEGSQSHTPRLNEESLLYLLQTWEHRHESTWGHRYSSGPCPVTIPGKAQKSDPCKPCWPKLQITFFLLWSLCRRKLSRQTSLSQADLISRSDETR